ncbi:DUF2970 domain-containing protein [Photobacterium minamisatsumaniensis]|uniref:DUF2970 domain-containing protein n=1 Tax=Photobacterium minamisatsumaniensis TaxID=2910233 RepID=UPI003D11A08B
MQDQSNATKRTEKTKKRNVLLSVGAAFLGVQSDQNRHRDFSQVTPWPYIIGGILFIVLFVVLLIMISQWVTS